MEPADQALFERKVVRFVLPKYKKHFDEGHIVTQHVKDLRQLGNLEYYGMYMGGYKEVKPTNIGSLLNAFQKTSIHAALNRFLDEDDNDSDDWQFVFSISSTTALYVIMPRSAHGPSEFDDCRFTASVMHADQMVTIMRLDDLLRTRWSDGG